MHALVLSLSCCLSRALSLARADLSSLGGDLLGLLLLVDAALDQDLVLGLQWGAGDARRAGDGAQTGGQAEGEEDKQNGWVISPQRSKVEGRLCGCPRTTHSGLTSAAMAAIFLGICGSSTVAVS